MVPQRIQKILAELPAAPGVYILKDRRGKPLYVGKAKDLRSRVRSYFQKGSSDTRFTVPFLLARVEDLEVLVTDSEKEAVMLEFNLIKKYRTRYNIRLRDDKAYLCLRVDTRGEFPRLQLVRRMRRDGSLQVGPFANAAAARETIRTASYAFGLRVCSDAELRNRVRPCVLYEMGRCSAPCVGYVTPEEYAGRLEEAISLLKGDAHRLVSRLEKEMQAASRALDFERAAELRDRIQAVSRTVEHQKIISTRSCSRDIVGIHRTGDLARAAVLFVREGNLVCQSSYRLHAPEGLSDSQVVEGFLSGFYGGDTFIPPEIHVPALPESRAGLEAWLGERREGSVHIAVPRRGEGRKLLEMASRNAALSPESAEGGAGDAEAGALEDLRVHLGLREPPVRMDCFDISHLRGGDTVGSMSVAIDGIPAPALYRHYHVRTAPGSDDYAALGEVLERRYRRAQREGDLPDVVVLDGGRGQLSVAARVLASLALELPVFALAKGRRREGGDRVYAPDRRQPVDVPEGTPAYHLLQRLRDEAHRFAVGFHRKTRARQQHASDLQQIPGIGPRAIARLRSAFRSREDLRAATVDELQRARLTRQQATAVYEFLARESGD